ncbi:MAG: NACHT domain-containing protein, partial [Thermoanaerobaculia bacterium]|nr:NACHT domain-containing protein [Thermoanaerobaculia bacterium]
MRPDLPEAVAAAAPHLSLRWLGGREIQRDGVAVHLESAKTEALFAWLVLNPGRHTRAKLNALLWPDLPEGRAAAGLRRALWDLRRKLAPAGGRFLLEVSRTDVGVSPAFVFELDVRRLLEGGRASGPEDPSRLEQAAALYGGDLLEGLAVEDSAAFEEWLLGERESLRLFALSALRRLVGLLRRSGEGPRALAHARRLLALDPWLEEAHRDVAELLALSGRRGAAIRQLEACRRVLQDELGAAPSKETVALERQLRGDAAAPVDSEAAPVRGLPRNDLPVFSSPFVGRSRELEAVVRQLADPGGRLLVLLGPGGVGKTRLAVQAASRVAGTGAAGLADGAVFLPPPTGAGDAGLATDLARVLELEGGDCGDPAGSLMAALRDARLLLVLDAFERRRAEAPLLSRLLDGCPELRVLVTSRERLGLAGESVLEVGGLEVPARSDS